LPLRKARAEKKRVNSDVKRPGAYVVATLSYGVSSTEAGTRRLMKRTSRIPEPFGDVRRTCLLLASSQATPSAVITPAIVEASSAR